MIFNNHDNDPDEEDFYETAVEETPKPKVKKNPPLRPDDPNYYDVDDEWEHIRPASKHWKLWVWIAVAGVFFGALYALYIRYCTPYSEDEVQYGYVEKIARKGNIFKTFEGTLLPYKSLADTVTPYEGDIRFSAADDHVAADLLRLQLANLPARVKIATYHATLPWRGESRIVITDVDTADVTKIYPPTLNHPTIPQPHIHPQN